MKSLAERITFLTYNQDCPLSKSFPPRKEAHSQYSLTTGQNIVTLHLFALKAVNVWFSCISLSGLKDPHPEKYQLS